MFTPDEIARFDNEGYLIVRQLAPRELCARMTAYAEQALAHEPGAVEYEADLHYPGAPPAREAPGGHTVRRLLQVYARHALFRDWAAEPEVTARLAQLLGPELVLSQAHHNSLMTKQPRYSSDTLWHQDIRYWSFEKPELVSVWLALGVERADNGALKFLPGSHKMEFAPDRFDAAIFFRTDLPENQALIATARLAELEAGDVVFFHCRTLHAAGRNRTEHTKFSLVYTYHGADNHPLPGTRSAGLPEIPMTQVRKPMPAATEQAG